MALRYIPLHLHRSAALRAALRVAAAETAAESKRAAAAAAAASGDAGGGTLHRSLSARALLSAVRCTKVTSFVVEMQNVILHSRYVLLHTPERDARWPRRAGHAVILLSRDGAIDASTSPQTSRHTTPSFPGACIG